jgi:hypothetical protein
MKKSFLVLALLVGFGFSAFAVDSPINREKKKNRKAKAEQCCDYDSKEAVKKSCTKEGPNCCSKK